VKKIDLNIVWDDAKAMAAINRDLLTAIAGMFLLLPGILADQFMTPLAEAASETPTGAEVMARFSDFAAANWHVLLIHGLVTSFGILALQSLLLRAERLTVGESLRAALLILPSYIIANILQGFGVMTGLFLFLLPGFYLIGRFALVAPVAAAERPGNPLTMLQRSAELTRGNGWKIFGLLLVIFVVMLIVATIVTSLTGIVAELLLSQEIADFAMSIVGSFLETAFALVTVLVSAALYRAATTPAVAVWEQRGGL
jgi:hypothetical protein